MATAADLGAGVLRGRVSRAGPVERTATEAVVTVTSDPQANQDFDAYVRAERGAMLRYAVLLCGSPAQAEDIVQEVLARVYLRWGTLDPNAGRRAYLRRSLTNEFLSWRRRWSTRMVSYVDTADLYDVADRPRTNGRDEELWSRLSRLPNRQRAAVVLRYYEGLSDDEIAETLGCGSSTVRAHISRALTALRQQPDLSIAREN